MITCCNLNKKTTNQDVNSVTGVTEKSDQMQTAGPHEENTKREKPDVKSWMKNYKKQRTDGKSNPGEQQTNEKAKQSKETLSRSRLQRETVHQRSEEKQSQTATAYSNKVENEQEKKNQEMEERPKAKQTREERRDGGESGGDLENRYPEDFESSKGHVENS